MVPVKNTIASLVNGNSTHTRTLEVVITKVLKLGYTWVLLTQPRLRFNSCLIMSINSFESVPSINQNPIVMGGKDSSIGLPDCKWDICLIDSFLFQLVKAIKGWEKGKWWCEYIYTYTSTPTASESFQLIHHNFRRDYMETNVTSMPAI